ncbi:MAG: response regulator [Aggregatilineales bacterium]
MYTTVVIDDVPANIYLLQCFLKLYGINAIGANTGQDGFTLTKQHQPALVLVDLRMPEPTWNGYQVIEALRAEPGTAHIPIVAVTASGDETAAREAGCNDVLFRPFQTGQLKKIISQYLALA